MSIAFLIESTILFASFWFAYKYSWKLIEPKQSRNADESFLSYSTNEVGEGVKQLFAISIALAVGICEMLLFEITDNMFHSGRTLFWSALLWAALVQTLVILPLSQLSMLVPDTFPTKEFRFLVVGLTWIAYLFIFWITGSISSSLNSNQPSLLEYILCRVAIIGTFLIASMSGFAAGSTIQHFIFPMTAKATAEQRRQKEARLAVLYNETEQLRNYISAQQSSGASNGSNAGLFGSAWNSFGARFSTSKLDEAIISLTNKEHESNQLRKEIANLNFIERDRKSTQSPFKQTLQKCFSLYCIARVFQSLTSLVYPTDYSSDPISSFLAILSTILGIQFNKALWSQAVSFTLALILLFSSSRTLFPIISKVLELFSEIDLENLGLLFLSQLIGIYFIATLIMLKLTLPPPNRIVISTMLSGINLSSFGFWFDKVFLISAALVFVVQYLTNGQRSFQK